MKKINFAHGLLLSASLCVVLPFTSPFQAKEDLLGVPGGGDPLVKMPSGEPVRTFEVGPFNKVAVGSALQVILRQGDKRSMVAYGPKDLVDHLRVKEQDGRITIDLEHVGQHDRKEPVVLVLGSPEWQEVHLSGASMGVLEKMNARSFVFGGSGAAQAQLDVNTGDLKVDLSGGSQLELTGNATVFRLDISGGSRSMASGLSTENTTVNASGGSQVEVHCNGDLTVQASGASTVEYTGDPKVVNKNAEGVAVVRKK